MSELKARTARSIADEEEILKLWADSPIESAQVYLKSEADKVIAEKDTEIDGLKERIEVLNHQVCKMNCAMVKHYNEVCDDLIHHKYKRCLAMAKWCETNVYNIRRKPLCDMDEHEGWQHDDDFWQRWYRRWLELAEKFKEAK